MVVAKAIKCSTAPIYLTIYDLLVYHWLTFIEGDTEKFGLSFVDRTETSFN